MSARLFFADYILPEYPINPRIGITLQGAFGSENDANITTFLYVYVQLLYLHEPLESLNVTHIEHDSINYSENITTVQRVPLVNMEQLDTSTESRRSLVFDIGDADYLKIQSNNTVLRVRMRTNVNVSLPIQFSYNPAPIDKQAGVIYAACVLLGLYIMIIWEVVHRTFAAMLASTMSIAILAAMNERPTMGEVITWIDVETLLLLFGMMILVAILSETGIFDYLAVYAYKVSRDDKWILEHSTLWSELFLVQGRN